MLRRILPAFAIGLLIIVLLTQLKSTAKTIKTDAKIENLKQTIILDAGHGGFDGGAVGVDGTLEKDINLKITKRLEHYLKMSNFNVILTRTDENSIEDDSSTSIANRKVSDMKNRLKIINEYPDALFISIHLNKFSASSVHGAQVFYSVNNDDSLVLADSIQNSLTSLLKPDNERCSKKADKTIYLMKHAKNPAVIIECGFLSNKQELSLLKTDDYQGKLSFAIYCGILDYLC